MGEFEMRPVAEQWAVCRVVPDACVGGEGD